VTYRLPRVEEINAEGQTPLAPFTYDLNGNRSGKSLANGTSAGYTYDDASRLTQLSNVKGAAIIAQFDYAMDVVNRRTNRVEPQHSVPSVPPCLRIRMWSAGLPTGPGGIGCLAEPNWSSALRLWVAVLRPPGLRRLGSARSGGC